MPPRHSKSTEQALPDQTLIVDNGAYTIKAGFAKPLPELGDCHVLQNCLARDRERKIWVGSQLDNCQDFGSLAFRRPVEKGYIVNWEVEKTIWESIFFDKGARLKCDPHETNLVLAEAPNTPAALQTNCDQIIFEEFEFASYNRCLGASLNAYHDIPHIFGASPRATTLQALPAECMLLIDSGFSHTTVTPLYRGRPIQQAIRRLDLGGKFLANYLKELLSARHYYDMSDETYLINEIKETVCYVTNDFKHDLDMTWKGAPAGHPKTTTDGRDIVVDYVLPDYHTRKHGFMRPHDPSMSAKMRKLGAMAAGGTSEAFMTLGNERFVVPELLFNPGDIGMKQAGLPETVLQSLSGIPTGVQPAMLANILVVGGNSILPGLMERLETEIRQLAPAECTVRIARAPDPIKSTWLGGAYMAADRAKLKSVLVTRQEYQEYGSGWLAKVFSGATVR